MIFLWNLRSNWPPPLSAIQEHPLALPVSIILTVTLFTPAKWLLRSNLSSLFLCFSSLAWPIQAPQNPFVYDPLPGDRHIHPFRISGDATEQISIFLDVYPLDSLSVEYETFSYTWGPAVRNYISPELRTWLTPRNHSPRQNPGRVYNIKINDRSFDVAENLYNALVELRRQKLNCNF